MTDPSQRTSRGWWESWGWRLVLYTAVVCHIALAWSGRSPGLLTGQDDAEYILLGRALSHGSYQEPWRIDSPLHSQYPPGYPALLALSEALGGKSYDAKLAVMIALSAAMLLLLHGALRRRVGEAVALCSVVVLAVNPYLVRYAGDIVSETPFTFLSVACLYCLIRFDDAHLESRRSAGAWLAAAAAAALMAALTRTVGISLLGAVCLWIVWKRQAKATMVFALAAVVTFGSWMLWTTMAPEQFVGRSYIADALDSQGRSLLTTVVGRVASNLWVYATSSLPFLLAFPTLQGTGVDNVVVLVVLAVGFVAGIWAFAFAWPMAMVYFAAYMSALAVFRWQFTRFLVPIVVILVPWLLRGAMSVVGKFRPALRPVMVLTLTAVIVFGGAERSWDLTRERGCNRTAGIPQADCGTPDQASYFDALRFIEHGLPKDAVLLTAKSGALYYYVARKSISVEAARGQRPEQFLQHVTSQGANYILLASLEGIEVRYFAPLLQANCERLHLVKSFSPGTHLFSISPDGASSSREGDACDALAAYRTFNATREL